MEPNGEPQGRALLVSGALGMGHEVTAQICAASLAARGWSARTVDAMRLLGPRAGAAGEHVFRSMLAVPGLYDAFYFAALRPGTRLARLADAGARRQLVPQLTEHLDRHPADLAISVFATGASAISAIAARYPALKHVVFCRDATPHRLWVHPHVDVYLVTSHMAECAVRRFQPEARVRIVAPPVRAAFQALPSQAAARDMFGIPGGRPAVLLMSGGWGWGPVAATAIALADAGIHVLAVAGRNARMEATLRAAAVQRPRIRAFGCTDRIPELMAAADLVITSPGDTCAEARAVGRRLLLLDVLPGHGRDNCQHQLERGNAWITSAGRDDVLRTALAALAAPEPEPGPAAPDGATGPARVLRDWEDAFSAVLAELGFGPPPPPPSRPAP